MQNGIYFETVHGNVVMLTSTRLHVSSAEAVMVGVDRPTDGHGLLENLSPVCDRLNSHFAVGDKIKDPDTNHVAYVFRAYPQRRVVQDGTVQEIVLLCNDRADGTGDIVRYTTDEVCVVARNMVTA